MDRDRFSFLAHAALDIANPVSSAMLDRAVALTSPTGDQAAIDIGCGKAELLVRLAERHGVRGTGIERSGLAARAARERVERRAPGLVTVLHGDAAELVPAMGAGSFDLGVCIGSTHALGDVGRTLDALVRIVRPGGHIVLGEGYWKKPPSAEYLARLGGTEDELRPHHANVALGVERGLAPVFAATASEGDWDEYEWAYARGIEDYVAANPGDPEGPGMLERIRTWNRLYVELGRETMGFGVYVFRRAG